MRLTTSTQPPERVDCDLLAVPVSHEIPTPCLADLDLAAGGALARAVALGDFRGRHGEKVLGYPSGMGASTALRAGVPRSRLCWDVDVDMPSVGKPKMGLVAASERGPRRIMFLGVGPAREITLETVRAAAGSAVREAEKLGASSLGLCVSFLASDIRHQWVHQVAAEGLVLASWRYEGQGAPSEPGRSGGSRHRLESAVLVSESHLSALDTNARLGYIWGSAENLARTLQAMPGNVATPVRLADEAARIADKAGLEIDVLGPAEMRAESMGALLSVAQGSNQEPRLIVLRHNGGDPGDPPLVLVGKGLTFDAGGISIKPAKGMEKMKYDMSGGAAVLGAMLAIGKIGMPANVVGIVPSSENLLGGSATKPGDVVTSRSGKSIEVINTDAEGRLILADALGYAVDMKPAAIVDCATLTGACVVALGHHRSAVLGNDDALVDQLLDAGETAGQPCWRLPLDKEYRRQLRSDFADLKNVGGRAAGTITAACFLSEFVDDVPWAHLDIAGTAYGKTRKPYLTDGPHGRPCRLLLEWVRARVGF